MNKLPKFSKIWSTLFLLLVLGYMIFIFSKTVWRNYSINQQIYKMQTQVQVLQEDNLKLKNLVVYYQSDSYKERMARLLLNYKMPDEKVVAFPLQNSVGTNFNIQDTNVDTRSNLQKWSDFLFKKS